MARELILLDESDLRFRIVGQHVQVYPVCDPQAVLGSQYLGRVEDTFDHHQAWDLVDRILGHMMPADLVDEEYLEAFDGIAYIGGGFAFVRCPACGDGIRGDELQAQVDHHENDAICPHCGSQLRIIRSHRLSPR